MIDNMAISQISIIGVITTENLRKSFPISEVIAQTDALMVKLDYKPSVMRHFRQAWNALKNHALKRGETVLTPELGFALLREHYHIEPFDRKLTSSKSITRRAVMLLLEFQVTGRIAKRQQQRDHSFPLNFKDVGNAFIENLIIQRQPKEGTILNYHKTLEAAFTFFAAHGADDILAVNTPLVNQYLKTYAGCCRSYISGQINQLKRFFAFALRSGFVAKAISFPEVSVYKDRKVPEYYTPDEIKRMLDAVDRANPRGKRDYAMLLLGSRYGLRVCDIKALEMRNIDFNDNTISITQIKTGKPLALDLLPDVGWAIIDYIKNGRPQSDCPKIFIRHVVPYTSFKETDNLAHIIGRYALAVGIKKPFKQKSSFHMLRYGLASALLQQDVSLTTISGILGHSELNVTATYTKIDVPQLSVCALEEPK